MHLRSCQKSDLVSGRLWKKSNLASKDMIGFILPSSQEHKLLLRKHQGEEQPFSPLWGTRQWGQEPCPRALYRAFHWRHAVLQHGRRIAQTDLGYPGHHAPTRSLCTWTKNGEVHGETVTHNNVKRCLYKMNIDFRCYRSSPRRRTVWCHMKTLYSHDGKLGNWATCGVTQPGSNLLWGVRRYWWSALPRGATAAARWFEP